MVLRPSSKRNIRGAGAPPNPLWKASKQEGWRGRKLIKPVERNWNGEIVRRAEARRRLRRLFEDFCHRVARKLGLQYEEIEEENIGISCVIPAQGFFPMEELTEAFMEFLRRNKPLIDEADMEVDVCLRDKLIGGYEEYSGILYQPWEREVYIYANFYSDYSSETEPLKEAEVEPSTQVTIDGHRFTIEQGGRIVWNDATWTWMALGEASVRTPVETALRKPGVIKKLAEKVINIADDLADEVYEETEWAPYPEEEE